MKYKLHLLKTKRHKQISLSIVFRNYVDELNYTKKALLFKIKPVLRTIVPKEVNHNGIC